MPFSLPFLLSLLAQIQKENKVVFSLVLKADCVPAYTDIKNEMVEFAYSKVPVLCMLFCSNAPLAVATCLRNVTW